MKKMKIENWKSNEKNSSSSRKTSEEENGNGALFVEMNSVCTQSWWIKFSSSSIPIIITIIIIFFIWFMVNTYYTVQIWIDLYVIYVNPCVCVYVDEDNTQKSARYKIPCAATARANERDTQSASDIVCVTEQKEKEEKI